MALTAVLEEEAEELDQISEVVVEVEGVQMMGVHLNMLVNTYFDTEVELMYIGNTVNTLPHSMNIPPEGAVVVGHMNTRCPTFQS